VHYDSCPLGHAKLDTTARYTQVATNTIRGVMSPLDRLTPLVPKRMIAFNVWQVTFKVKDYRIEGAGRYTTMTLDADEFIRRFLIHVLPKGFHRIRHYGLFAGSNRAETIKDVREFLNLDPPAADASAKAQQTGETDPAQPLARPCPCCGGRMFVSETFEPGRQPRHRPTPPLAAIRLDTS
jgi:hypothetical protein